VIIMPIIKDVRKLEPKFIGPLTKRQVMVGVPAGIVAYTLWTAAGDVLSSDVLIGLIAILDLPILACALNVYDMPMPVFIRDIVIPNWLSSKKRIYRTENSYEAYTKQNRITYEYFEDADEIISASSRTKKQQKIYEKRLKAFLKENPDAKAIE